MYKLYDFEITANEGFVKLKGLNQEAVKWMRIVIFKPCGIISPIDLDTAMIQHSTLEEFLRMIMAEGFRVNFIKTETVETMK